MKKSVFVLVVVAVLMLAVAATVSAGVKPKCSDGQNSKKCESAKKNLLRCEEKRDDICEKAAQHPEKKGYQRACEIMEKACEKLAEKVERYCQVAEEVCGDSIDNDSDGMVDEGCTPDGGSCDQDWQCQSGACTVGVCS